MVSFVHLLMNFQKVSPVLGDGIFSWAEKNPTKLFLLNTNWYDSSQWLSVQETLNAPWYHVWLSAFPCYRHYHVKLDARHRTWIACNCFGLVDLFLHRYCLFTRRNTLKIHNLVSSNFRHTLSGSEEKKLDRWENSTCTIEINMMCGYSSLSLVGYKCFWSRLSDVNIVIKSYSSIYLEGS